MGTTMSRYTKQNKGEFMRILLFFITLCTIPVFSYDDAREAARRDAQRHEQQLQERKRDVRQREERRRQLQQEEEARRIRKQEQETQETRLTR